MLSSKQIVFKNGLAFVINLFWKCYYFLVLMTWRLNLFMHGIIASSPVLGKIINSVSCFCNTTSFVYIYIFFCTLTFILSENDECLNISHFLFIFNYLVYVTKNKIHHKSGFCWVTNNLIQCAWMKNFDTNYFELSRKENIMYKSQIWTDQNI